MDITEAVLTRITLSPDEVLVVRANIRTRECREELRDQLKLLFPENRVVIWPKDMDLTAVNFKALANG